MIQNNHKIEKKNFKSQKLDESNIKEQKILNKEKMRNKEKKKTNDKSLYQNLKSITRECCLNTTMHGKWIKYFSNFSLN